MKARILRRAVPVLLAAGAVAALAAAAIISAAEGVRAVPTILLVIAVGAGLFALAISSRRNDRALFQVRRSQARLEAALDHVKDALGEIAASQLGQASAAEESTAEIAAAREAVLEGITRLDASIEAALEKQIPAEPDPIEQRIARMAITRDVSALLNLHDLVDVTGDPPPTTVWTATPETLLTLVARVQSLPDGATVLEAGSGLSTVWLALAVRASGRAISLVCLEHDEGFAAATRDDLARQGLEEVADIRVAPLRQVDVDGESIPWYDVDLLDGLGKVHLLFVDGPPGFTGPRARLPAFPLLEHTLVDGAMVILDDTDRDDEKAIVEAWVARSGEHGRLYREREIDRASVLQYRLH